MANFSNKIQQKSAKQFSCLLCHYNTDRKCNYDTHNISYKHIRNAEFALNGNKNQQNSAKFSSTSNICIICNKSYHSPSGLWRHKQKCQKNEQQMLEEKAKTITDKDELIMFLIKENSEFKNIILEQQNMMMKVLENGTNSVTNNTNTNCMTNSNNNNKAFNLNFFLNETCKDAMNITDFVDSIKLQLSDLEKFGEVGYVEGISNIITTNLKALDVTQRPVHCTDKKRETMYIKDENHWEKEDENKTRLRKAIKHIANKNIRLLPLFREKYPDYKNSSSRTSDKYDKMVVEAMGGAGNNDIEKEDKIIRNISNITTIEKLQNNNIK